MHTNDSNKTIYIGDGQNIGFLDCILAGVTVSNRADEKSAHTVSEGYTFGYTVSGCGSIEAKDRTCPVSEGSFYFIAKGQSVCFHNKVSEHGETEPWERIWVQVDGVIADDLVRTFRLDDVFTREVNVRRHFLEIHDKLSLMNPEQAPSSLQRIACLLFEILTEVRRREFFSPVVQTSGTADAIKTYLDNNLYRDLSLDLLTEKFGFSKMHIIRLFKKEYATTPMQYLMERRISLAKNLLSGTVMPIKEISDLLRFSNTQHFSNTFRNAVGVTPNGYRKSKQKL